MGAPTMVVKEPLAALREELAQGRAPSESRLDYNQADEHGRTALNAACSVGNVDFASALLERGADPNLTPSSALHPLVCAMCYFVGRDDRADIVGLARLMLDFGLDVDFKRHGNSLLHEAAYYDLPELCIFLIESGANIEVENGDGLNAKQLAEASGSADALRSLCAREARSSKAV